MLSPKRLFTSNQPAADATYYDIRLSQLVLPNPENTPTIFFEGLGNNLVALSISDQLGFPEVPIGTRNTAVSWTLVPKATINKYGQPFSREYKIGLTKYISSTSPTLDLKSAKYFDESYFSSLITTALHIGHDLRAFFS